MTGATDMTRVLILKTVSADMTAYGGFAWPKSGPVTAPDWDPRPVCGRGLHGLLWGCGSARALSNLPSSRWVVYEADPADVVNLPGDLVKARAGSVVYCGDRDGAIAYLDAHGAAGMPVVFAHRTAGDHGTATAGDYGTAITGHYGTAIAGIYGTSTARDYGIARSGFHGTATAGFRGIAVAGEGGTAVAGTGGTSTVGLGGTARSGLYGTSTAGFRGTATTGDRGTSTAGFGGIAVAGDNGIATAGERGTARCADFGTAIAGEGGIAAAGIGGRIQISWWDESPMPRVTTRYVGEDGIKADVAYRCDRDGRLVRA